MAVGDDVEAVKSLPGHFLGAVVVKQLPSGAGDPSRSSVIDGQQRLTTLQLLLDAAQFVMEQRERDDEAESIHELVLNDSKRFRGTSKRFKLWPSRVDRDAFEAVMDNDQDVPASLEDSRIVQAHGFFVDAMNDWASDEEVTADGRLSALAAVLQQHLQTARAPGTRPTSRRGTPPPHKN